MASWGCVSLDQNSNPTPAPQWNNPVATDDSAVGLIIDGNALPGPTIYLPNGNRYIESTNALLDVDANNNYISYNYNGQTIVDTLGRTVSITAAAGPPPTSSNPWNLPNHINYYDSNGKAQIIIINYGASPAATTQITVPQPPGFIAGDPSTGAHVWENQSGLPNYSQGAISSIVFPDGSSYSFQYDWIGDLIKIGYPDGGYTRYDYAQFSKTYPVGATGLTANWVSMQLTAKHTCSAAVIPFGTTTIAPGNTCTIQELTTTYQPTPGYIYNNTEVVTDPDGTTTTYQFNPNAAYSSNISIPPWTESSDHAPVEMSHTVADAQGNVLEQVKTTYESDYLHPSDRTTTTLYGQNIDEQWTYSTQALSYGGANLLGGGVTLQNSSTSPNLKWTVASLTTSTHDGNVRRHDYIWQQPAFTPNQAYFAWLKTEDDLYDYAVSGYIEKTQYGYDANSPTASGAVQNLASFPGQTLSLGTVRGNMTSESRWSSTDNAWIGSTHTFDDAGNILQTIDARGIPTNFSYADYFNNSQCSPTGGGKTAAYLTSVTNDLSQTASATYNSCTGTKATTKDVNQQTTTYTYWSPTDQLESVSYPDGGLTSFCYDNIASCASQSSARSFIITTQLRSPDPTITKEEDFDGLGRSFLSAVISDPCELEIQTLYDNRERVYQKSFPYVAKTCGTSPAQGPSTYTTYLYNGINLPTSVQVTGSVAKTWSYSGQTATETDENGNKIARTLDNVGRLATVMEPNASGQLVNETDYQYDANNNLKQVDEWGGASGSATDRKRTFVYDTLSRLTQSNNPEAGVITYSYDKNSNLTSSTDARGLITDRTYDSLNRLTETDYSDSTPSACYFYDTTDNTGSDSIDQSVNSNPIGRLTAEWTQDDYCDPSGIPNDVSDGYALNFRLIGAPVGTSGPVGYDAMGRLVSDIQCPTLTCLNPYLTQYKYDVGGALDTQTVSGPPGAAKTFTHSYDAGGREIGVASNWSDATHPSTLFQALNEGPFGITAAKFGVGTTATAIAMSRGYDTHGRTVSEADSAPAVTAVPAVQATATISVAMAEQHTTSTGAPSTGSITFSEPGGTDQYSSACSCYETGIFTVLVDVGTAGQIGYIAQDGTASTPTSIASGLAASINGNSSSLVTATSTGPTVYMTSKANGAAADYPFVAQSAITNPNFVTSSFVATPASGTMTGGANGSGTTVYDSGTSTVTIGSLSPATISWTSSDSSTTIATRLAAAINTANGATVTATSSGSQIVLKAVSGGTAGDLTVQTSGTFNTQYFSSSSVSLAALAMAGGANAIPAQSAGVIYQYSAGVWQDNGNLKSITDSVLGAQTFTYADHLNRLTAANFNGAKGNFTLTWQYDAFGNRQSQSVTGTSSLTFPQPSPATYTAANNNRADSLTYDRSGNFLGSQLTPAFTYDAASRLASAGGVCYLYNAEGIRTAKGTWSGTLCYNYTAEYILGSGGEQLTELDGSGNWKHTNIYGAGKMLATYDAAGTHFHLTDWLGTARMQVSAIGAIDETCISMPFGDDMSCSGPGTDATEHHFTGKERDVESGLDYFAARYFESSAGRWMSPDWAAKAQPIPYAKLDFPQSLNLYAYVENNPLTMADADGHQIGCTGTVEQCQKGTIASVQADDKKQKAKQAPPAQQQMAGGPPSLPAPRAPNVIPAPPLPAAVQLQGLGGSINGPAPAWMGQPPGTNAQGNLWNYQIVDANGNPASGDFILSQQIKTIRSNTGPDALANTTTTCCNFQDYIGFFSKPDGTFQGGSVQFTHQQTFSVSFPGGSSYPLSTVVQQQGAMQQGVLQTAAPTVVVP